MNICQKFYEKRSVFSLKQKLHGSQLASDWLSCEVCSIPPLAYQLRCTAESFVIAANYICKVIRTIVHR